MAKGTKKTRDALTYETLPALFTGICDAIRTKTGEVGTINHQDIPATIAALPTGGAGATVIHESGTWNQSAASVLKTITIEKAGKLNMIFTATFLGSFYINKNGSTFSPTLAITESTKKSSCYYNVSVAANDVITIGKVDAVNTSYMLLATIEEDE